MSASDNDPKSSESKASDSQSSAPTPPAKSPPAKSPPTKRRDTGRTPRRGGKLAGLAVVLALLALIAVGYGGWRLWQLEQGGHSDTQAMHALQARVQDLGSRVDTLTSQRDKLSDQLQSVDQHSQGLNAQVQSLSERSRSLENAVAGLTARAQSGHDALRLDEATMLLRMADERYTLFHDATSAMQAYAMADDVMSEVEDPSYAGVHQSILRERKALAATHPGQRQSDLDALSDLRANVAKLPLKPLDQSNQETPKGFWQRTWHAVSGLVRVSRDHGDATPAKRSLSRSLTALDLAQAQAALLAWDQDAYRKALQQADDQLAHFFDPADARVQKARARIKQLNQRTPGAAPELGAALHELRNLRSVHDAGTTAPAHAASTGNTQPAAASTAGNGGTP